jgi:hypothetical protein
MHERIADKRRFRRIRLRQHERAAVAPRSEHHRQRSADGAKRAAQCELAREFVSRERRKRDLPGRRENAERNGQVEAARFLGQVRRREIDRDLARRKLELRVL